MSEAPRAITIISPGETATATPEGAKEAAIDLRIAEARQKLSARLGELERRVEKVKATMDPRAWLENPWARIGVAAAVGFALGRSSALRPIVRAALGTAVTTLLKQAVERSQRA